MFQAFDSRGKPPLRPEEVSMVQGLLREYCADRSLEPSCAEAQEAARELLGWFQIGVTNRERLRELLNSRTA